MNFKNIKLLIGFGVCAIAASGVPACGGDDDDDGKKPGTGGKDAGSDTGSGGSAGSGGTGGTGGSTGGSGGSGGTGGTTMTCGAETCKSYDLVIANLPPCCAGSAKDKCGVDLDESTAGFISLKAGCYELNQKGNLDTSCPPLTISTFTFPGCCNTAASKCSYMADISGLGGPNMGCVDPAQLPTDGGSGPAACTPTTGDAGSDAATDATSDAMSDAATDATSDATGD